MQQETYLIMLLVLLPYWGLILTAIQKLTAERKAFQAKEQREKEEARGVYLDTRRKRTYDGVAFAAECAAKCKKQTGDAMTSEAKLEVAAKFLRRDFPETAEDPARDEVESILPKIMMEGATGKAKI